MSKWAKKILLSLAVLVILGHGMITHYHHDDIVVVHHDDHDDDHDSNDHHDDNAFSFKYLDHFYSPHTSVVLSIDHRQLYTLPDIFYFETPCVSFTSWRYLVRNEYPPPLPIHYSISLRGPPVSC